MAAPVFQSVLQPTKLDQYIDELGLTNMTPEAKLQLADDLTETVQYKLITRAFTSLTVQEKTEYVRLMQEANASGNYAQANDFLYQHFPDIEVLVEELVTETLEEMRPGANVLRKVSDDLMAHIAKQAKYMAEGQPNLPIDTSKIPAQPEEDVVVNEPLFSHSEPLKSVQDDQQAIAQAKDAIETQAPPATPPPSESESAINDELDAIP